MKLPRYFFAFFFVSGFCSLVYEVIWLRLSMARFGVTTPMVSIVLSVFMAGLGLGSWLGGKWMRGVGSSPRAPLRLYGLLELLIGVSAFAAPATIDWGYRLLRDSGGGLAWGSSFYYLASGAWVTLALLPWCTCMGATFPFAMAAIRRMSAGASEHSFSFLYLANVLGAIAGTVIPAFVLIELFGFYGTLRIASAMNVLLAVAVFGGEFTVRSGDETYRGGPADAGVLLFFIDPVASIYYRLVQHGDGGDLDPRIHCLFGKRGLRFCGDSGHVFGGDVHRVIDLPAADEERGFGLDCTWFGSLLPLLFADPRLPLTGEQYTLEGFLFGAVRAGLGVILFSGLAGYLTPMLVDEWSAGDPDRAGRAYAMNVVGSILGPLVAGFGVLPWAGEHWGLCLVDSAAVCDRIREGFWRRESQAAICRVRGGICCCYWFSRRITAQSFRTASNCAIMRRR